MTLAHPPLVWNESLACGIPEIDEQHQILVDLLNVVSVPRTSDTGIEMMRRIVLDILNYAMYHFETEELMMQRYGYSESAPEEATRHLEQHRLATAQMTAARSTLRSHDRISLDQLISFLREWLERHIPGTDVELCAFLREARGPGPGPAR
jgi:hemerythrin